ncbi:MAG: hemolysin family protein [Flavobacteriaceae bacterium]|jgi:putative hemolysin|nr:HlyC/CorC family transporter [Flavobacteriales bacterium]MDG1271846.1 hemolysin family protein [Flavobacteriaceae bacterium]
MISEDFIILSCLVLSAFFSGMEIAFVSANRIELAIDKQKGGFISVLLKKITQNPSRFIATMLVGNNIALVAYGIFMGDRITALFFQDSALQSGEDFSILLYQTLISTMIILITAEFLPKVFFQLYANRLLKFFLLPTTFFYYFLAPISRSIIILTDGVLKRFFQVETDQVQLSFSKVELGDYIEEQIEQSLDKDNLDSEIQIFQNALEFSDVKVREAMVPRAEIIAVAQDTSIKELQKLFVSTGLSKILIYRNTLDDIIGYVHAFEMFKQPKNLKSILLPMAQVHEPMPVNQALKVLTKQRKSIAVVIDEYGGTAGIVTLEDIVEELFGEIEDEHDSIAHFEKKHDEDTYEFSARLEVDYLNQTYDLGLPENEFYETLGGMIVFHTEDIPDKGAVIEIDAFSITVVKVSSTKIERLLVQKNPS